LAPNPFTPWPLTSPAVALVPDVPLLGAAVPGAAVPGFGGVLLGAAELPPLPHAASAIAASGTARIHLRTAVSLAVCVRGAGVGNLLRCVLGAAWASLPPPSRPVSKGARARSPGGSIRQPAAG